MNEEYFENKLKELDSLIPVMVESKQSVQMSEGVWNSETMSTTEYIPANSPDAFKIYTRLKASFINRIAIFEALHFGGAGFTMDNYMRAMAEIRNNLKLLEQYYKVKSVSLLEINRHKTPPLNILLFEDISLCDFYTRNNLGVSVDDIMQKNLPEHLNGTQIQEQTWFASKETILEKFPTVNDTDAKPQSVTGSL